MLGTPHKGGKKELEGKTVGGEKGFTWGGPRWQLLVSVLVSDCRENRLCLLKRKNGGITMTSLFFKHIKESHLIYVYLVHSCSNWKELKTCQTPAVDDRFTIFVCSAVLLWITLLFFHYRCNEFAFFANAGPSKQRALSSLGTQLHCPTLHTDFFFTMVDHTNSNNSLSVFLLSSSRFSERSLFSQEQARLCRVSLCEH